jgi:hypothetical protein
MRIRRWHIEERGDGRKSILTKDSIRHGEYGVEGRCANAAWLTEDLEVFS